MRDFGLTLRMIIASTVLLGVYAAFGLVVFEAGGLVAVSVGLPVFVAGQYMMAQLPILREETTEIDGENFPELYLRAEALSEEMNIEMPKLYISDTGNMNAFALGRRGKGKVVLTRSLLRELTLEEIEPILAHEFAHLENRDSILMGMGTSMVSLVSSVLFILFLIESMDSENRGLEQVVGAVVSGIVHLFLLLFVRMLSRYREYVADEAAVEITGRYEGMVSALSKISHQHQLQDPDMSATRSAISFVGFSGGLASSLFATHPSPSKRISRIQALASEAEPSFDESDTDSTDTGSPPSEDPR